MKRIVLLTLFVLTACDPVVLEKYPRPFACDHNGGDGGKQCADDWECGFTDRCFPKNLVEDGGLHIDQWQCENEKHCPTGWQCGVEVDEVRRCQQLGVGAPSPCALTDGGADAGGCQGGWRCGADDKCFNPAIPDAGTTMSCSVDEQCPLNFTCGELVKDRGQHCVEDGKNAPSDCNTDLGCRGSNRCDTFAHRCVTVTDMISTGLTTTVSAVELSPRFHEQAPVFFAMTRMVQLRNFGTLAPNAQNGSEGVIMASIIEDGGLRVAAQFLDEQRMPGQPVKILFERTFSPPGGVPDVSDLAVSSEAVMVRFRDGGASRLSLGDGSWSQPSERIDLVRQRESLDSHQPTGLIFGSGNLIHVEGSPDLVFDSGVIVNEVVAAREGIYAFTNSGSFLVADGGTFPLAQGPMSTAIGLKYRSKGAVAAYVGQAGPQPPRLSVFAQQPLPDGGFQGTGVVNLTNQVVNWDATPIFPACPDAGTARQLSIDVDDSMSNQQLFAQCVDSQGLTFPVTVNQQGMGQASYRAVVQDQLPFQQGLVNQYASPFVRAHAGTNGRVWHAIDTSDRGLVARLKLRPVQLDRQPETMLSLRDGTSGSLRVFAQSDGRIFTADPQGGFISQLEPAPISPLSIIASRNWIVGTLGLLDAQAGEPRIIGTLPAGETFSAPATGVTVQFPTAQGLRDVVLVASADSLWLADVTDALAGAFAQPAVFSRVLVPVPGVPLRSMALSPPDGGSIAGFLTTNTANLSFSTSDLVRWMLNPVSAPMQDALPLEVWNEVDGGAGRTGYTDGQIWSLPIMVPLTQKLLTSDGGSQQVSDYGRKCGDVFAVSAQGLFRAQAVSDGGLPAWSKVSLPVQIDSTDSLKLYETKDDADRLFVATHTGQVIEITGSCR